MIYSALSSGAMLGSDPGEILEAASIAGLHGMEWSVDGRSELGNLELAGSLMLKTLNARLSVASYATLFRAGVHANACFSGVLASARALQAPIVRVWSAPKTASVRKDTKLFLDSAAALGDAAAAMGITVCYGLASGTILDSCKRASSLFKRVAHPFVKLAWEPSPAQRFDEAMESFGLISGHAGLLVVRFLDRRGRACSLRDYEEDWISYLDAFDEQGGNPDMPRYAVIRAINGAGSLAADARFINHYSGQLRRLYRRRAL